MQTSPTRLKKPLYLWLARILGFGIVLASLGMNFAALPEAWHKIQHEGRPEDFWYAVQPDGSKTVVFVSSEAAQKGIAIGDTFLYPEDTTGEVGTPVTLRFQRGDSPVREVTLIRKPHDQIVQGGMLLGLSQGTSTFLALLFLVAPIILEGIAALLLCALKSDDWMALLTAIILANLQAAPKTSPYVVIFGVIILPLAFAWLFLFPNGKLAPRWSWVLIFFILPSTVFYALFDLNVISYTTAYLGAWRLVDALSALGGLGIVGVMIYRYRRVFSSLERQQTKWAILPFLLVRQADRHALIRVLKNLAWKIHSM